MHLRNDAAYSHTRASGFAKFLAFQAVILTVGLGWAATRVYQLGKLRQLPLLRETPLECLQMLEEMQQLAESVRRGGEQVPSTD